MDVRLPNGTVVRNVPENITQAELQQIAIANGLATAEDFGGAPVSATEQPLPAQVAPTQPAQEPSMLSQIGRQLGLTARGAISGAAALPAILAEPIVQGVNLVAGREVFPNQYQALQSALTNLGLPEPATGVERGVQAGVEALTGVGSQARLAQASGSALLAPFGQDVAQQAAAAVPAAIAAQATSERAAEVGFSPTANVAATLAVGTLAGITGAKAQRGLTAERVPAVTMDQVKNEAAKAYGRVDNSGVTIKPKPILDAIDDIERGLVSKENFNPKLDTHRPVQEIIDQMRSMVGTQRVSFTQLDQLRQTASALARESKEPATRRLAAKVVEGIDRKATQLQPTDLLTGRGNLQGALKDVKEARDSWRRVSKATILEDALNVAEARALDPKASEGELIRTQFKTLAANKEKMRLFSKEEQEAIRRVVSGEGSEKVLALLARFNPERSQLMTGLTIGAGFANPYVAGATAATGIAADKALAAIQRNAAQNVIARILSGQIPPPRSNASWRALVEAETQAMQGQESVFQEENR
jgi:hypothetical protein